MGQQQLMLVILVVVVVGIATIVAANVISSGANTANRDAIRQDLLSAASSVQHIWEKPEMMGGAGRDFQTNYSDEQITEQIDITGTINGTTITNENATYTITSTGANSLSIEAEPRTGGDNLSISLERQNDFGWIYSITDGDNVVTNEPLE